MARYLVEEIRQSKGAHQWTHTANLWMWGDEGLCHIWDGDTLSHAFNPLFGDHPTAALLHADTLYVGLMSGAVERRIGREEPQRLERRIPLTHRGGIADPHWFQICGFALHDGNVYEASALGLVESDSGTLVDDRSIASVESYGGRLLIVPSGAGFVESCKHRELFWGHEQSQAGHLIDALSKEALVKNVRPFDGSGFAQGTHGILDDILYTHHGNWPNKVITRRRLHDGDVIGVTPIPTSYGFLAHSGVMYDLREVYLDDEMGRRATALMRSDVSQLDDGWRDAALFLPTQHGEQLTGAVSTPDGVLLSLYNASEGFSRFVHHHRPERAVFSGKGRWVLRQG